MAIKKQSTVIGTEEDFFARGKNLARKLDRGEKVEPESVVSFEDGGELAEYLAKQDTKKE